MRLTLVISSSKIPQLDKLLFEPGVDFLRSQNLAEAKIPSA